jgi:aldose 1-epimerase
MALLDLVAGDLRAVVAPEIGGAIATLRWKGLDILRPAPPEALAQKQVRAMGSYPLVPYSNRIGHGRLRVGPRTYALRPNFAPEPHAIHGVGWQRAWRVAESSPERVLLTLSQAPDADWPFRFTCRQSIALEGARLTASLEFRNEDDAAFPAGLGFHPFFPAPRGTRLRTHWKGWWTLDELKLPASRGAVPPEADFSAERAIDGWRVDNPFYGWSREARLAYPTHEVRLTASEALDHAVAFAPGDGREFLALEPVSHTIDAFRLAAEGVAGTGARFLAPGESWRVSMTIEAGPPGP